MVSLTMPEVNWAGLVLPFSYLGVMIGAFFVFSTIYRKRKINQSANLQPWFPPHLQRDVYLSLLHMDGEDEKNKVPPSVIRAALLRRAVEDINRIIKIRTAKQACQQLLERGSVGDDLWQRFQRAEKEMEEELRDVVMEANALVPNWGQFIFQTANTILNNEMVRTAIDTVKESLDDESKVAMAKLDVPSSDAPRPTTPRPSTPAPAIVETKAEAEKETAKTVLPTPETTPSPESLAPDAAGELKAPASPAGSIKGTPKKKKKGKK